MLTQIGRSAKFASLGNDLKRIHIWLLLGHRIETLRVLIGHSHNVTVMHSFETINNNKKRMIALASGSEDGSIRIWNVKSGECLQLIMGHDEKIIKLEPIGMSKLASCSLDGTIRVWDVSFHFLQHDSIISDKPTQILETNNLMKKTHTIGQDPTMVAFKLYDSIDVFDLTTCAFISKIPTGHFINSVVFVDGLRIACAVYDGPILIWNVKTGICENTLKFKNHRLTKDLHTFENTILAAVSISFKNTLEYCWIDVFDIHSGSHKQTIPISDNSYLASSVSLDNHQIAVGFLDGTIEICNVSTGECTQLASEERGWLEGTTRGLSLSVLLFTSNGKLFSFNRGRDNSEIRVWKVQTRTYKTLNSQFNFTDYYKSLEWLGKERFAYFFDNNIQLLNSDGLTLKLTCHTNEITVLKWLGNDTMASGSKDGSIKIWQIESGECLETFSGHAKEIAALVLVNKNRMASFAPNESVRVWNIDFRQAQSRVFTYQEVTNQSQEKLYFVFNSLGTKKLAIVYPEKISILDAANENLLTDLNNISIDNENISLPQSHGENTLTDAVGSTVIVTTLKVNKVTVLHSFETINNNKESMGVLASGSEDGSIRIWNVTSGECLQFIMGNNEKIVRLESIGMSQLESSSLNGTISFWDLFFHFVLHGTFIISDTSTINFLKIQTKHRFEDPKGFVIASDKSIQVYDLTKWVLISTMQTSDYIKALEYIGKDRIACGLRDGSIQIWNIKTSERENVTLRVKNDALIKSLHSFVGKNNKHILAAVAFRIRDCKCDTWIYIWNMFWKKIDKDEVWGSFFFSLQQGSLIQRITINVGSELVSSLSLGEYQIVTGFKNGKIQIWNVETGECAEIANEERGWLEKELALHKITLVGEGQLISFFRGLDNLEIRVWNMDTFMCKALNVRLNIDQNPLEWIGEERFAYFSGNNIHILNSNGLTVKLTGHTVEITVLKWLGNDTMASGSKDGTIKVWQIDTGECLETFSGHTKAIVALVLLKFELLKNKSKLLSFARNEEARVWNIYFRQTGTSALTKKETNNQSREHSYIIFKALGANKLAIVYPYLVSVWDVLNDKPLLDINYSSEKKKMNGNKKISLLRSYDENTLIGAIDSTILLWNVDKVQPVHVFNQHRAQITSLEVSSNTLFSGSLDMTTRIWDLSTCTCLITINERDYVGPIQVIPKSLMTVLTVTSIILFDEKKKKILNFARRGYQNVEFLRQNSIDSYFFE